MRQPRRDPETYQAAMSVQVLKRKPTDKYGNEQAGRGKRQERKRTLQTRNGVPVRVYKYRGTGESMSENEAAFWLFQTRNRPQNWADCVTCEGPLAVLTRPLARLITCANCPTLLPFGYAQGDR